MASHVAKKRHKCPVKEHQSTLGTHPTKGGRIGLHTQNIHQGTKKKIRPTPADTNSYAQKQTSAL